MRLFSFIGLIDCFVVCVFQPIPGSSGKAAPGLCVCVLLCVFVFCLCVCLVVCMFCLFVCMFCLFVCWLVGWLVGVFVGLCVGVVVGLFVGSSGWLVVGFMVCLVCVCVLSVLHV